MPRKIEKAACDLLTTICGPTQKTPAWLMRPGRAECGKHWPLVQQIYHTLSGLELPETMPPREWRKVDGVFQSPHGDTFIFELDEKQHFNAFRAATLRLYPTSIRLGFSVNEWLDRCHQKTKLERGGFGKPKPPLFPGENGRHRQRAFRDALADLLPSEHGFVPTLRLSDIEVEAWVFSEGARNRMAKLIEERMAPE